MAPKNSPTASTTEPANEATAAAADTVEALNAVIAEQEATIAELQGALATMATMTSPVTTPIFEYVIKPAEHGGTSIFATLGRKIMPLLQKALYAIPRGTDQETVITVTRR